jgi:NAD(P)-dependent dehydrogenase (short-subunit alcohol dehydrogenase family)
VATTNPISPVGEGGWALGYGCAKGGLHRAAGIVACELAADGIRCFNLQPGMVATERVRATPSYRHIAEKGKEPSVVGAAVIWLLSQSDGTIANGRTLAVDDVVHLLPTATSR